MKDVILFSEIVESNGKTIRQNNMEIAHKYPVGSIVEVNVDWQDTQSDGVRINLQGICTLYVVATSRDCDGTPLYCFSDIPVQYRGGMFSEEKKWFRLLSTIFLQSYNEDVIVCQKGFRELYDDFRGLLEGG